MRWISWGRAGRWILQETGKPSRARRERIAVPLSTRWLLRIHPPLFKRRAGRGPRPIWYTPNSCMCSFPTNSPPFVRVCSPLLEQSWGCCGCCKSHEAKFVTIDVISVNKLNAQCLMKVTELVKAEDIFWASQPLVRLMIQVDAVWSRVGYCILDHNTNRGQTTSPDICPT